MSGPSVEASLLERARASRNGLSARLLLAAAVQRAALSVGARTVVTGGTAVDFYAAGATGTSESLPLKWEMSGDVDLVVFAIEGLDDMQGPVLQALEERLGMRPRYHLPGVARVVDVPDFLWGLELVGRELRGDPKGERVFTVLLDGQHPVTFQGPEAIVLSYAESGWHLRHTRDWERALAVYRAMREHMDHAWLIEEAQRRRQLPEIRAVMDQRPSPWRATVSDADEASTG